jgi:hypothetical protein
MSRAPPIIFQNRDTIAPSAPVPARTVEPVGLLDAERQTLAYVYGHADIRDAEIANSLTLDEARRIAANCELPVLLGKARPNDSLETESNLSDKRHEDEDTTPKDAS